MDFYEELREKLIDIIEKNKIDEESVTIRTNELTAEEAIGITERKDFPILNGKEVLIEADFKGTIGQSYSDLPTAFSGSIKDILELDLEDNRNKVLFIASLNAILKHLGLASETIHCKNEEPEKCGKELNAYMKENYGGKKIGLVGLQPAMLDNLSKDFDIRVLDLNIDSIGKEKYGVIVEDGRSKTDEVIEWADVLLVTGSTINNGSIINFLDLDIPVIFYGTSIAGAAYLQGLNKICFYGK